MMRWQASLLVAALSLQLVTSSWMSQLLFEFENEGSFLRQRLISPGISDPANQQHPRTEAGKSLLPLVWLHVPKTGSSFATTLAHYGCPGIPANTEVEEPTWQNPAMKKKNDIPFKERFPEKTWCQGSFQRFTSGHDPILPGWAPKVATMLRDPKMRFLSGYYSQYHDCPTMKKRYKCLEDADFADGCPQLYNLSLQEQIPRMKEYYHCTQNCASHMLRGYVCGAGHHVESTHLIGGLAATEVQKMGFVGLTEHWALSVCLFHAKFGGTCYSAEFTNVRPGGHNSKYNDALKLVEDWSMGADQIMYDSAQKRFWQEIDEHQVTKERCQTEICPDAAQHFN